MARHGYSGDALIEVLHAAQKLYGHLPSPVLRQIARRLKLPPSRVLGVATFYHLFHVAPRKRHRMMICEGTACYVAGATALSRQVTQSGRSDWDLEIGRCVGFCGLAPVAVCDGVTIGRLDAARLEKLISAKDSSDDK
ncbi:MAG: NAD(P)H-dependent oxidoreductase subunit E [Bryobacteraceae bacterium]|nr:NAD(P)H-dependent oxidoreductase subunit E [Bryobacteraceae bacterium]